MSEIAIDQAEETLCKTCTASCLFKTDNVNGKREPVKKCDCYSGIRGKHPTH